jgi:hypothetical protein
MKPSIALVSILTLVACGQNQTESNLGSVEYPLGSVKNVAPGRGLGTVTGSAYLDLRAPDCVTHEGLQASPGAGEMTLSVRSITSTTDFDRTITDKLNLGISDASEKPLFDVNFNHAGIRQATKSATVSIGEITIRKEFPYESLKNPQPSAKLLGLKGSTDPYAVYKTCGDSIIYGYKKVVEVTSYVVCETFSESRKRTMDDSLKGFGIYKGMKFSLDAGNKVDAIAKANEASCSMSVFARGGKGSIHTADIKAFVQSGLDYANNSGASDAFVEAIETLRYDELGSPELNAALSGQATSFPEAERLLAPFLESGRNLLSIYLSQPSDNVKATLKDYSNKLKGCAASPWNLESCTFSQHPGVNPLDTW